MRDRQLYEKILGIEKPWKVTGVDVDLDEGEVRVHVANLERKLPCPQCGRLCGRYDARPRRWRHLDTCQYPTILIAEVPRVECEMDGVLQVRVPWAVAGSRFTALFESLVIDWLKESSISAVARLLRLSWEETDGIQQRAVQRGLVRRRRQLPGLPKRLGVDETSFRKRHQYATVVLDQDKDIVVHLADGRGRDTLDGFFDEFSKREREAVESVAMDMHGPYIAAVTAAVPDAGRKIAFDRFHVARHMVDAVDKVRRREHKELKAEAINPLTGTRYLWLQNPERMEIERLLQLDALKRSCRKTARAWAIKELARSLWHYRRRRWAREAWLEWYSWAIRSRLEPVRRVARMVKTHLEGIVNAVVLGVTNARSEAVNAKIQWVKYTARGFRNRKRFHAAIYFHLGGLDLYPRPVAEK
jgi:transposase